MEQVFMTVLTNPKYIPGVRALFKGLRRCKSKHKLVVLIPEERQKELSIKIKFIEKYGGIIKALPMISVTEELIDQKDYSYWNETFFKLQVAGCIEYSKIILIDSDMLILKNIDHLFNYPNLTAVVAGKIRVTEWKDLNSGLIVLEPSTEMHEKLISLIPKAIRNCYDRGKAVGDQDVFHVAYPDWPLHKELHLGDEYNLFFRDVELFLSSKEKSLSNLYIVHFVGSKKPWQNRLSQNLKILKESFFEHKRKATIYFKYWKLWR